MPQSYHRGKIEFCKPDPKPKSAMAPGATGDVGKSEFSLRESQCGPVHGSIANGGATLRCSHEGPFLEHPFRGFLRPMDLTDCFVP